MEDSKEQNINEPKGRQWFALYTRSRCEKKVAALLTDQGISVYLPLMKTLRQWSDRKRWVEVPLFSSYLFVYSQLQTLPKVLQTDGAVYFIKFEGKPAAIPDEQIESLKILLGTSTKFEISFEEFTFGQHVEVKEGPLKGMKGVFVEYRGKKRVLMRIDAINQNLVIEIHPALLRKQHEVLTA